MGSMGVISPLIPIFPILLNPGFFYDLSQLVVSYGQNFSVAS